MQSRLGARKTSTISTFLIAIRLLVFLVAAPCLARVLFRGLAVLPGEPGPTGPCIGIEGLDH